VAELVSRRSLIGGVTASGLLLAGSALWKQPASAGTQSASQIHVEFGNDAAREMTVSWSTPGAVSKPRVVLGTPHGGFGLTVPAETLTYTDATDGVETYMQHARIRGLRPASTYIYSVFSDGGTPVQGTFTTAPVGRVPFRFTSFGDIGSGNPTWSKSSLNAITATSQIEQFDPVVHLLNGDLSYANVNQASMPAVWADFGNNTQPSAMNTPWMPCLGSHEVEAGNGELGYNAYHTRYAPPSNQNRQFNGNWYSFQVGSALFISLDNNDVVYENDGGVYLGTTNGPYLLGYSGGQQEQWLAWTLRQASLDPTTGSSPTCTSRRCRAHPAAAAATSASGRAGSRCSTPAAWTSCSAATITTTSAATWCTAPTPGRSCARRS
jgi:hypothetical protein